MKYPITIPKTWKIGSLNSFSRTRNEKAVQIGPFGSQLHHSDYVENGTPVILPKSIINQKIVKELNPQTSDDFVRKLLRYKVKQGDLIISRIVPVNKVAIINKEQDGWLISGDILRVRLENPEIDSTFLFYLFQADWFFKIHTTRLVGTTTQKSNEKIICNLPLVIPPLDEQQEIINILRESDSILDCSSNLITHLQLLKKGLLQRLFAEGIGHSDFKEDIRLGKIPKEWEIQKIENIGNVVGGGTPSTTQPEYWTNGTIFWVVPSEITALRGKFIEKTERMITERGFKSSGAKILPPNSLLVTSRATLGACAINTVEITTNQGFQSIIPELYSFFIKE